MARIDWVDRALREWAQHVIAGDGSGYPMKSTLHPQWSIPRAGSTPTLKAACPSTARQTHRAIATLSMRLRNTLIVHYVLSLPTVEQCERLSQIEQRGELLCARAVELRIERAHHLLAGVLRNSESRYSSGML